MSPLRHHWGEAQIALTFLKIDLAIGLENTGEKKHSSAQSNSTSNNPPEEVIQHKKCFAQRGPEHRWKHLHAQQLETVDILWYSVGLTAKKTTGCPLQFESQINNYVPNSALDMLLEICVHWENYLLFIWSSSSTECPRFLLLLLLENSWFTVECPGILFAKSHNHNTVL